MNTRQRFRRIASRLRNLVLPARPPVGTADTHHYLGFDIPVDLMRLTGGGPESFDAISACHIANLQREVGLEPQHCVLELGCGIGRDAIPMTGILTSGRYLGIDIIKKSIDWCSANITRRHPNFQFVHFDVKDQLHNAGGTTATQEIRIPLQDASVDRVIAQSVFTHLYAHDIAHYLREIRRVLKPSGLTYLTFFVYDDEVLKAAKITNPELPNLRFEHQLEPDCRIGDPAHPLGSIAYTKDRVEEMVRQAGLEFAKPLLPGAWSGYYNSPADGQDVAVLGVAIAPPGPRVEPIGPETSNWRANDAVPREWREQWIERGYVTIKGLYPKALVQAHAAKVDEIRRTLEEDKDAHGFGERIGQLHQAYPELMRLAVDERVRGFLQWAFGDQALLFGSLNFERGTQQDTHIDAIFFYLEPVYAMAGLWVALEDVHPDAGPLFYLPGSHRWPFIRGEHLWEKRPDLKERIDRARALPSGHADRLALAGELGMEWTKHTKELERASAAPRELAMVEAGDAVFWHGLLAHGGSARADPARTRKSVVYHFIGEHARLYTFDEFMLQTRAELLGLPGQKNQRKVRDGLPYIAYDFYSSYKGGREIMHPVDQA